MNFFFLAAGLALARPRRALAASAGLASVQKNSAWLSLFKKKEGRANANAMLLEDLDSLAAASSPVPTAAAAAVDGPSGRKQKAYGARGKAERKDARRQARKMDRHHQEAAAAAAAAATIKSSSKNQQQQQQQQQAQAKAGIANNDEDDSSANAAIVHGKSGSGRKAGRSRSSSASAGSALESLAASSSPKPNRRQQPSTKSAKSRRRVMEEDTNDAYVKMAQQSDGVDDHHRDDREEEEDQGFDNMDDADTTDQDEDEEHVAGEEDGDDDNDMAAQTQAAKKKKEEEEAEVGSPPIQLRTRPYVRGRIKRTIEDDDEDDNESDAHAESFDEDESSNEEESDDELIARQDTAKKVYQEQEANDETEGNDARDDMIHADEKEKDGQVLDEDDEVEQAQASLGGVLAATTSTTGSAGRRTQQMLASPNRRHTSATHGAGGVSARFGRGGGGGGRHSHGGGDALALMQIQLYPEEQKVENHGNKEANEGNVPESLGTLESFFSGKSDEHLTDPDGDLGTGGLLTQGSDITGSNQSVSMLAAAKKAKRGGMGKRRVVESPYSTNSRLSDAESFQGSTGIGGKKKAERDSGLSKKKKGRRHYDSDDDYPSETDRSDQEDHTDGPDHKHRSRRRSSRQKQQRKKSTWYAGDVETDDDEENEFVDDDEEEEEEEEAGDTNSGEEEVVAASKSRRRRGGEGAKCRARSSTKSQRRARSNAVASETNRIGGGSDDEVDLESSRPEDRTPKSAGKKRKESSVEETPRADNRSLTQMGRDVKKEKRQKSSTSSAFSSKYGTNTKFSDDGQHDSLSFHSQSQTEGSALKSRAISVSKKAKGRPTSGAKKEKRDGQDSTSGSTPRVRAGTLSKTFVSNNIEDPFMDRDPSIEAEKEDPIDEFEESLGFGLVDSDDENELNTEKDVILAGSTGTVEVNKAESSSPPTENMGEAGRRRRQRLQGGGPSSFTSTSVLETGTKLHKPTIRWSPQVTGTHTKASSSKKKSRSGKEQPSEGNGFVDDDLDRTHSESGDEDDDDDDINALKTQPEEGLSQWYQGSISESEGDDDGDPDYQSSQPVSKSGQQPRQKKRRIAARASEAASGPTLMTTAGDTTDLASAAAAKGKCRAQSKRVLATITEKLRTLSSLNSQNQKDVTEALKKQTELYSELQQMRSLMESPAHFHSILESLEGGINATVSTFSFSLKFVLSTTMDSKAKIDAEGRRKRLSALCTCLRFFVGVEDVADGHVATNVFNSFSRYGGGGRLKFPIVSEDMREVLSDPKIVSQLLIAVQCQDSIQKRSRPNQVEIKLRAQASYLSCACLSLVDPERAIDQILSSPPSSTSKSISIKNAIGNLHRLAISLDTMDSYSQVELSLLFLIRTRRTLLTGTHDGTNERRRNIALKTLKRLDESLASVYRNKISRLNMHPPSILHTKGGDGLPFTAWARECTRQGNGYVRTFGCKAVFNPQNKDAWGPTIHVLECIHINKSSLSFFVGDTDSGGEMNTFRSNDSSITEEEAYGENASTAAASFPRDRLSIERLYGTTKLVETYFDDWEDNSDESAIDEPIAYIRASGAITIYLSSEGMKSSNLAKALDEKLQSNAIHIEVEKSEFAEFTDLLKARGVVLIDGDREDGQPASQDSMGSVTTASYREEEESRVFDQVEYNTSKIRGVRRPQDDTEESDDDAEIASQDDGVDDGDGRTDVGLGEDDEGMVSDQEDSPDKSKPSRPSKDSKNVDILEQASVPKRKYSSLGKREEIPVDDNDDDYNKDDEVGQNKFGHDTATSKGGKRSKHKKIDLDQRSARATKTSHQQEKQVAEKQPHIVRAQTREVTPLPEPNASSGHHDKQPSTSPAPHRSNSTMRTSQNLDSSFARVDGMKKPLASISASFCAMSVVGGSSTAFNLKHTVSDDLAGDVIEYDAALGQAVAALSHVRHLAKKIEHRVERCKSIDAGGFGRSTEAGYDEGDQSSSSPAFGWIDESYHQVAEKQKEWIRQRESTEKELSGILLCGLQPASKDQCKTNKKK